MDNQPEKTLNNRQKRTLQAIFANPVRRNIEWTDIETLLKALDASVREGNGSRVRITLRERDATFHRPHPEKETNPLTVRDVRRFLENAGVDPNDY